MEEDKDIKTMIPQIATIGKDLFSDFLSELTRQRQLYLLFSSIVTILLAYPYIKNLQGDLAGIEFSFVDLVVAKHIAGWICTYFVLVYASSVIQDMQYRRYKIILSQFQLDLMLRTQSISSQLQEIKKLREMFGREDQVAGFIQKLLQPKPKLKERLKAWFRNIKNVPSNVLSSLLGPLLSPRHILDAELSKEIEKTLHDDNFLKTIGANEIKNQLNEEEDLLREKLIKVIQDREYESLQEIKNRYDVINRLRLFFEVLFPIGISCFAIWASLLK